MLVLYVAIQGSFQTRVRIVATFARESAIQQAQLQLEEALRLEIDEQNSLRGYLLTRDPFYVDQYHASSRLFDARVGAIARALESENLSAASRSLQQYRTLQAQWRENIALPLLAHPDKNIVELDRSNKVFSDYQNEMVDAIRADLADTSAALTRSTQLQLDRSSYSRALWLLGFGLLAILLNGLRTRLYRELEEEKNTTEVLQRAFRSEIVPLPNCELGTAYLSASSHLAVGGDVFDVYRLSNNRALLLIADVSGKGVDAAVLTAFIKFTIRGIALRRRDPGAILAEFNTAFAQAVENPYLFVSMLVGILNTDDLVLEYASAGHDSAFVRRSTGVQQLAVTGPVLGVMEEPFGKRTLNLDDGDILVLATDGLTEARKRSGEQLHESGAMQLIERASDRPQQLADELAARVRLLGGNRLRDDLAILAIRVNAPTNEGGDG